MELFIFHFSCCNWPIVLELDGTGPLYHQVYRAFRSDILSQTLAPGERVPSTRALAELLKVSRNTAVAAYEQARVRFEASGDRRVSSGRATRRITSSLAVSLCGLRLKSRGFGERQQRDSWKTKQFQRWREFSCRLSPLWDKPNPVVAVR